MRLQPCVVILFHLINVVRDVALLNLDPVGEVHAPLSWMIDGMFPNGFGQGDEQLISSSAQATNYFERLAGALMKIAQRAGPTCGIKYKNRALWLRDKTAAADIGTGFAVGKVKDNFVDTPTFRCRLMQPHLFGKLAQRSRKESWRAPE